MYRLVNARVENARREDIAQERIYQMNVPEIFHASAKTREEYRRAVYTTFKIDKIVMPGPASPWRSVKTAKVKTRP